MTGDDVQHPAIGGGQDAEHAIPAEGENRGKRAQRRFHPPDKRPVARRRSLLALVPNRIGRDSGKRDLQHSRGHRSLRGRPADCDASGFDRGRRDGSEPVAATHGLKQIQGSARGREMPLRHAGRVPRGGNRRRCCIGVLANPVPSSGCNHGHHQRHRHNPGNAPAFT